MWGALLTGVVDVLGAFLDIERVKLLRQHSDEYLKLELHLFDLMKMPYDDMDDLEISATKEKLALIKAAFERDISLIGAKPA